MKLYGLIGYPLGHSFSKGFFSEKFEREKLVDCAYESYPIATISEFPDLLIANPAIKGINVTIPYKEQVIPFLNELSEVVQKIGACNCIHIQNGSLVGFNTDVFGFEKSLIESFPKLPNKALILGTGGAAKAVEYVLSNLGIQCRYVSRNARENQWSYEQLTAEIIHDYRLIINTSPLGMYPHVNECPPIPYQHLNEHHCLFDLVYNPPLTLFLKKGQDQGADVKNGYDMLVYQAEESWRIWNS